MSGADFAGALTAGDEYPGRDAEVEALAAVIWHASRADESTISATGANHVARAVLAAGYTRRPADWCHNGHPFRPGTTIDNDPPSDDWCDVCGEARRPASGGVPVEALRELADEIDACRDDPEPELSDWARYWRNWGLTIAGGLVRALLDSATTDGGESGE